MDQRKTTENPINTGGIKFSCKQQKILNQQQFFSPQYAKWHGEKHIMNILKPNPFQFKGSPKAISTHWEVGNSRLFFFFLQGSSRIRKLCPLADSTQRFFPSPSRGGARRKGEFTRESKLSGNPFCLRIFSPGRKQRSNEPLSCQYGFAKRQVRWDQIQASAWYGFVSHLHFPLNSFAMDNPIFPHDSQCKFQSQGLTGQLPK